MENNDNISTIKATATASLRGDTNWFPNYNARSRVVRILRDPIRTTSPALHASRRELLTTKGYILLDRYIGVLETANGK